MRALIHQELLGYLRICLAEILDIQKEDNSTLLYRRH